MNLFEKLTNTLIPAEILDVQVGLTRTAVLAETDEGLRCGLAATLANDDIEYEFQPKVRRAGCLHQMSSIELASLVESPSFTEASVGLATINALLPRTPEVWLDINGGDYLACCGAQKDVAVVGHFPFIEKLRPCVRNLWVLELNPRNGDLPAEAAPQILPRADLVAITSTTLINKTFQGLIELCRPGAEVILLGPSTPLSPLLYEHGVSNLSGTIITEPRTALRGVGQAISLHQLRRAGIARLVMLKKEPGYLLRESVASGEVNVAV